MVVARDSQPTRVVSPVLKAWHNEHDAVSSLGPKPPVVVPVKSDEVQAVLGQLREDERVDGFDGNLIALRVLRLLCAQRGARAPASSTAGERSRTIRGSGELTLPPPRATRAIYVLLLGNKCRQVYRYRRSCIRCQMCCHAPR